MTDRDASDADSHAALATKRFYGRWARYYDWIATAPGVASWRAAAVDALALEPGATVVEMGCGTGANLPALRERVGPEGRVVGVDLTGEMLGRASERVGNAGWANVYLVRGDATNPPISGPVDAVLATFVVGLFDDPRSAVDRWVDLLAPGGRVALLNAGRSDRAIARPLNLAFRGFVRAAAADRDGGAVESLEERVATAREVVDERSDRSGFETFGLGYLGLAWGERSDDADSDR